MKTATAVHVFIEIDRHKQEKLEFDNPEVTGRQIKEKAGVPLGCVFRSIVNTHSVST